VHGVRNAVLPHDEEQQEAGKARAEKVLPPLPRPYAAQGTQEMKVPAEGGGAERLRKNPFACGTGLFLNRSGQ
jgi:hypothetical protein